MYPKTITPAEMKRIETAAITDGAVSGEALMQKAAAAVASRVQQFCGWFPGAVAAVCGTGNNGGDAIAALRILHARRPELALFCLVLEGQLSPDARRELDRLSRECPRATVLRVEETYVQQEWFSEQGQLVPPALLGQRKLVCIIDGLFGTGLSRPVEGTAAALIRQCNRLGKDTKIVAVDIPSGLCGRTGQVLGVAVRATHTVTFHRPKVGLFLGRGLEYTGKLTVANIGLPERYDDADGCTIWKYSTVEEHLPIYRRTDHKGDHGRVVLLCGSPGMAGAAGLAATAALRTGAGLVTVACPERILDTVQQLCPCATCLPLSPDADAAWAALEPLLAQADVVGMGCGLGQSPWAAALVKNVLEWLGGELISAVIDADALNLLAKLDTTDLDLSRCVLTPHPGEAARLLGTSADEITADAVESARQIRQRYGAAGVVLKGAATVIDTLHGTALNLIGTPAMAKGGSGDVLTGVLCALLGIRYHRFFHPGEEPGTLGSLITFLQTGCGLHGYAGCAAALEHGQRGVLATDLCRWLGMDEHMHSLSDKLKETELYGRVEQLMDAEGDTPLWNTPTDTGMPPWEQPTFGGFREPYSGSTHWAYSNDDRRHAPKRPRRRHKPGWLDRLRGFGSARKREPEDWYSRPEVFQPRSPYGTGRQEQSDEVFYRAVATDAIGRCVTVTVEHPAGEPVPGDGGIVYNLNHGYVQEVLAEENRWQDACIYGVTEPLEVFEGIVAAAFTLQKYGPVIWLVTKESVMLTDEEIRKAACSMVSKRTGGAV